MGTYRTSDGVMLHYEDVGSGRPIVLIHGWSGSGQVFCKNVGALAQDARVIVPDLRGHGLSDKPGRGYRVARLAKDLYDLLEALKLDGATLVGCSMGAAVIWSYLELFGPRRVARIVLVDQSPRQYAAPDWAWGSTGCYDAASLATLCADLRADARGTTKEIITSALAEPPGPEALAFFLDEMMRCPVEARIEIMADHTHLDWRDLLPQITIPALVLVGRKSRIFPWQGSAWAGHAIPGAQTVFFENSGHWLYFEEPEKFNEEVRRFAKEPLLPPSVHSTVGGMNMRESCVWTTIITTEDYLVAVQTLARSLHHAQSQYPLYVLYTANLSDATVRALKAEPNIRPLPIELLSLKDILPDVQTDYAFARFSETWTKLRAWEALAPIAEKACFLDADMLVLQNMDEVFDSLSSPSHVFAASFACTCNVYRNPSYPAWWKPENCKYTWEGQGLRMPAHSDAEIAEALSQKDSIRTRRYFNAGLFVFRPSLATMNELMDLLKQNKDRIHLYKFSDQDFFNEAYATTWTELPYIYNALKTMSVFHKPVWKLENVKNIHYILDKPWEMDMQLESSRESPYYELNKLWWAAFKRGETPKVES